MLKTIIAKEFLNNILNLRFMIGLVLCIIITVACIMILAHDYRREMKDYNIRVNLQDEILDNYAPGELVRLLGMVRTQKPPERFRLLIIGIPGNEDLGFFDYNPLPILFPPLDFLFIVTIIMSLLAMLFSYDAIAGERQSGTLRLVISNSISRTKILFGKLVGGAASLLIPFILALLVGVLYVSVNPAIQWDSSAWGELALLTAASITFIMLFYLLGLMISTFSKYSAILILNCLFLWVLLVLVIPNVCPYISAQLRRIPSIKDVERREAEVKRAWREEGKQRKKEVVDQFRGKYGRLFSQFEALDKIDDGKKVQELADADPQFKAMVDAFRREIDRVMKRRGIELNKAMKEHYADLNTKASAQTRLAKNLAGISPLADFVYVARDLTGTGLRTLKYFKKSRGEYRFRFRMYVNGVEDAVNAAHKNEPRPPWGWFLDLRDHPRFVFQEESLKGKLGAALPYWGILVLFNVLFFAGAFAGFMRYDVR